MENIASVTLAGLAALSGVDVEQIRTYQELGLLPGPRQRPEEAGEILYNVGDLEILRVICRASALGFPVSAIADLLSVKRENGTCGDVYTIARRTLDAIRSTGFRAIARPPTAGQSLLQSRRRQKLPGACRTRSALDGQSQINWLRIGRTR